MGGLVDDAIVAAVNALTRATLATLDWVLRLLSGTVFHSPDVTTLPQVRYVSGQAQTVANACMGLAVVVAGALAMTHGSVQERYTAKEMLPRLLIGFTVANFAVPIVSGAIVAANALTQALTGQRFDSAATFLQLRGVVVGTATSPAQALTVLLIRDLVVLLLVALLCTWLARIGLLMLLAATGPIALVCHAFVVTEVVALAWWRALFTALGAQVLQAVTLQLAVAVLLTPGANLPRLGFPHDPDGLLNLLIAALLLWMVVRIPGWLGRQFGGGGRRGSMAAQVLRVVVIQHLLRGVRRPRRGGRGPQPVRRPPVQHVYQHHRTHGHLHTRDRSRGQQGSSPGERDRRTTPGRTAGHEGRPGAGRPTRPGPQPDIGRTPPPPGRRGEGEGDGRG